MLKQFICFSGVGAIGTAAHYCVLVLFVEFFSMNPVIGSIAGFLVGAGVNYTLNYHFTFKSNACHNETGPKFFLVAAVGFCINSAVMHVMVNILIVNYLLSQVISTGLVLFWNFLTSRMWVFNHEKVRENV